MDFYQYLSFEEHPEGLAIGVFIILFTLSYTILAKTAFKKNTALAIIISLIISGLAALKLMTERFYGYESILAVLMYIAIIGIFLKIAWAFIRNFRR